MTAPKPQDAAPKPCPFCGRAMAKNEFDLWEHPAVDFYCPLDGVEMSNDEQLAAWNRRAPSASEAALREALEDAAVMLDTAADNAKADFRPLAESIYRRRAAEARATLAAIRVIRAEDKHGGITGETLRRLLARLDAITAERDRLLGEVERLHERLEDNRVYVMGDGGQMVRQAVEPGSIPDGIDARDETIRGLDAQVARLKAERDTAYARAVEDAAQVARRTEIDAPNIAETYDRLMAEHAEKLRDAVLSAIRALAPGGAT